MDAPPPYSEVVPQKPSYASAIQIAGSSRPAHPPFDSRRVQEAVERAFRVQRIQPPTAPEPPVGDDGPQCTLGRQLFWITITALTLAFLVSIGLAVYFIVVVPAGEFGDVGLILTVTLGCLTLVWGVVCMCHCGCCPLDGTTYTYRGICWCGCCSRDGTYYIDRRYSGWGDLCCSKCRN